MSTTVIKVLHEWKVRRSEKLFSLSPLSFFFSPLTSTLPLFTHNTLSIHAIEKLLLENTRENSQSFCVFCKSLSGMLLQWTLGRNDLNFSRQHLQYYSLSVHNAHHHLKLEWNYFKMVQKGTSFITLTNPHPVRLKRLQHKTVWEINQRPHQGMVQRLQLTLIRNSATQKKAPTCDFIPCSFGLLIPFISGRPYIISNGRGVLSNQSKYSAMGASDSICARGQNTARVDHITCNRHHKSELDVIHDMTFQRKLFHTV